MRWSVRALVVVLAVAAAGCAVDEDSAPRDVPDEQREELRAAPPQQATGDSTGNDRIFLVVSGTDRLRTSQRETDGSPQAVMEALLAGPTDDDLESGLRSVLDPFTLHTATVQDDVVTVDVSVDRSGLSSPELRLAVAQIVYTANELLGGRTAEVVIKRDGSTAQWPDGDLVETDDPLTIFDFYPMAESAQPAFPSRPSPAPAPTTTTPAEQPEIATGEDSTAESGTAAPSSTTA